MRLVSSVGIDGRRTALSGDRSLENGLQHRIEARPLLSPLRTTDPGVLEHLDDLPQRERFTTGTRTQSRFLKIKLASALFNLGHMDGTGQRPDLGTGRNSPLAESI